MRKMFVFSLVIAVMILSSCGHPHSSPGGLTLKFNPMFGPSTLRLGSTYETPAPYDQYFDFTGLRMLLSHIRLVRANGSAVEVSPVLYVSIDDTTTYSIPLADSLGSYTALQFSIGLDTVQDNYDPGVSYDPGPSYALDENAVQNNMYWGLAQKYVFVKMDVEVDTVSALTQSDGLPYHIGTAPYYTTVQLSFSQPLSVSPGGQSVIGLTADFGKVFTGTNAVDPMVDHGTMTSGSNDTLAHKFMTNLSQSFTLQ